MTIAAESCFFSTDHLFFFITEVLISLKQLCYFLSKELNYNITWILDVSGFGTHSFIESHSVIAGLRCSLKASKTHDFPIMRVLPHVRVLFEHLETFEEIAWQE